MRGRDEDNPHFRGIFVGCNGCVMGEMHYGCITELDFVDFFNDPVAVLTNDGLMVFMEYIWIAHESRDCGVEP